MLLPLCVVVVNRDTTPEYICHALMECSFVRDIWLHHPGSDMDSNAPNASIKDLFLWVVDHSTSSIISSIAST